jgi:hypothetical protein
MLDPSRKSSDSLGNNDAITALDCTADEDFTFQEKIQGLTSVRIYEDLYDIS